MKFLILFSLASIASCYQFNTARVNSFKPIMKASKAIISGLVAVQLIGSDINLVRADETTTTTTSSSTVQKVPLYTKKSNDLQQYVDIARGFKLLRPFGFNEFEGAGGGYAVKFSSLFDVDENVVVGSAPATADKKSITDFGSLEDVGNKLAAKRKGKIIASSVRETDGIVFYQFEFENPLDPNLPRTGPKDKRPTKGIELYELCVAKGKLWSVQATSNDRAFPGSEKKFRNSLLSFIPKL